jgi:hypothetical protein
MILIIVARLRLCIDENKHETLPLRPFLSYETAPLACIINVYVVEGTSIDRGTVHKCSPYFRGRIIWVSWVGCYYHRRQFRFVRFILM